MYILPIIIGIYIVIGVIIVIAMMFDRDMLVFFFNPSEASYEHSFKLIFSTFLAPVALFVGVLKVCASRLSS